MSPGVNQRVLDIGTVPSAAMDTVEEVTAGGQVQSRGGLYGCHRVTAWLPDNWWRNTW